MLSTDTNQFSEKMQVQVLTTGPFDQTFTYSIEGLAVTRGQVVMVPFRRGLVLGVIWSLSEDSLFEGTVKDVETVLPFQLPEASLEFIQWVASYTLIPLGSALKMVLALPPAEFIKILKKPDDLPTPVYNFDHSVLLSAEQQEASDAIIRSAKTFDPFVLDGVTGSGKTEVYLNAIEDVLKNQGQALVLLPEIALTNEWLERFKRRFGFEPLLWHSNVSVKNKRQAWQQVLKDQPIVVVGARSALFLPFQNLHLIIVDEEHDDSYKQQEQNHYHARDMAVVRARLSQIPIVLASATPALETMSNIDKGKYHHLILKGRFANATLPVVEIVDMRGQPRQQWLSNPLIINIKQCLENQEQVLLFLNRRGYAPLTLCRGCGHRFLCPGCSVWLVQHKHKGQMSCHHCGFTQGLPSACPTCQAEDSFVACGPGVERIEEEARKAFPQARIQVVTSDQLSTPKAIQAIIDDVKNFQIDILIGTQVLAKGHHFPLLTLVGILDADLGLNGGDLRASEKTYQLLHQVSGRAGREQKPGRVVLQTYHPDHPLFAAVQHHIRDDFYACELHQRQSQQFPPYGYLAALVVSGLDEMTVERYARMLMQLAPQADNVTVLGPVPAPLARIKGRYRWRFLLKSSQAMALQPFLKAWLSHPTLKKETGSVRIVVDIDPYSFM